MEIFNRNAINKNSNCLKINNVERFESLKRSTETFKESIETSDIYIEIIKSTKEGTPDAKNAKLFEELVFSYYEIIIESYKKLSRFSKKYVEELIETYISLWKTAPRLKNKNYFTPYLLDLCRYLFQIKDLEKLAFFYNLTIFSKEIPFLEHDSELEHFLSDMHLKEDGEDPFEEIKEINNNIESELFDKNLFEYECNRFFLILDSWKDRVSGYHSRDEIFFMTGLFIMDEVIDTLYFENKGEYGKMECHYENALKYFKKAINHNPENPRYFYEYARCLKNSGKSTEAEIFFRKAFELNKI